MPAHTQPTDTAPQQLALSPEQAAAALGLGRTTVYALIQSGQLRSLCVGRRRIIPVAAIETFLAAGTDHTPDAS